MIKPRKITPMTQAEINAFDQHRELLARIDGLSYAKRWNYSRRYFNHPEMTAGEKIYIEEITGSVFEKKDMSDERFQMILEKIQKDLAAVVLK